MPRRKSTGYRRRFNFVLTDDDRDRVVAEWLNNQPNASEAIKALIYTVATGETLAVPISLVEAGLKPADIDQADPRVQALQGAVDT
jgi:hypothetical protein